MKRKIIKKKKKGFTLIELLAVILILAVIALIAIPIVTSVIEESKQQSFKVSMGHIVASVEQSCQVEQLSGEITNYVYEFENSYVIPTLDVQNVSGINGVIKVDDRCNTKVFLTDGVYVGIKGFNVTEISVTKGMPTYNNGAVIYYDPINNESCTEADNEALENKLGNEGCLKWYAFLDDNESSTLRLLLDHNVGTPVSFNSAGNINYGGNNALIAGFASRTSTWDQTLNIRPITAQELSDITHYGEITGNAIWQNNLFTISRYCPNDECSFLTVNLAWCSNCTTTQIHRGYWTANGRTDYPTNAVMVNYTGVVDQVNCNNGSAFGVRPVITINKSKLY